jgi:hypothetical protein
MSREKVQSLWIGSRLSTMERLSVLSYLATGYEFHLYTYGPVEGVPEGAVVRAGEEVLPAAEIFRYRCGPGRGSVSAFSNCFRYRLLLDRGGWWTDLDSVCVAPLEFEEAHVLGYERAPSGGTLVGSGLLRAPAGSALIERCWEASREVDRSRVTWGEIGPRLLSRAVAAATVPARILAPDAFYPVDFWRIWDLVTEAEVPGGCFAVHLWHSQWRLHLLDPDATYDPGCIYERLKSRYGVSAPPGAPAGPSRRSVLLRRMRRVKAALLRRQALGGPPE